MALDDEGVHALQVGGLVPEPLLGGCVLQDLGHDNVNKISFRKFMSAKKVQMNIKRSLPKRTFRVKHTKETN